MRDSSEGRTPLAYLYGHGNITPSLEAALQGKAVGGRFRMSIPPADVYGERDDSLIQTLPSSLFQDMDVIEPGMHFLSPDRRRKTVSRRG